LEGRNASRGVLGTKRSAVIQIASNSRYTEGILYQSMLLEQLGIVTRVNWSLFIDLARIVRLHKRIISHKYSSYIS
jgi:hypothetical protein